MLYGYDRIIAEMGMGGAIKEVMKHHLLWGNYGGINSDLEDIGIGGVEVTDKGFRFLRQ